LSFCISGQPDMPCDCVLEIVSLEGNGIQDSPGKDQVKLIS